MTRRALIVDDSKIARMHLNIVLSSARPNWEITESGDASQALDAVESTEFDIYFIDVNMPGMDGIELAGILKQRFVNAPMALVTANVQKSTHQQATDLGISVVGKPITEAKLGEFLAEIGFVP